MRQRDHWTTTELATFLAAARGRRLEAAWHLAADAGLRVGELLALRWANVDLDRARVEIRDAVVGVPYAAIKPPPMSCQARSVDLDPGLVVLLINHRDRQEADRTGWGFEYSEQDLVICNENGEPVHPQSLSRALTETAERAGLRPIPLGAIRRTRAALSVRQGALA